MSRSYQHRSFLTRSHLAAQPNRLKRAIYLLIAIFIIALASLPAWGESRFRFEQFAGLCGPLAEHQRVLEDSRYELVWFGTGLTEGITTGAAVFVRDGVWMVLLMAAPPGDRPIGCVVANGHRLETIPPSAEGR